MQGRHFGRYQLRSCQVRAVFDTIDRMSFTELSDGFFMKSAGWEAVKHARSLLAGGKVISSKLDTAPAQWHCAGGRVVLSRRPGHQRAGGY